MAELAVPVFLRQFIGESVAICICKMVIKSIPADDLTKSY